MIQMADSESKARSSDTHANTTEELQRMRSEMEALRRENDGLKHRASAGPPETGRWRKPIAILLVLIGCFLAAVSVPAVWLNRTVMDTDAWVQTVGPLAEDPAIQSAVANTATNELFKRVNVEKLAKDALPPQAEFLAGPLAAQVKTFARSQADNLVRSPAFSRLWIDVNRKAHSAVIAILTGTQGKYLAVANGKVTLDLSPIVNDIKVRLDKAGLGAVTGAIGNVGGTFTLFESPALAQAGQTLKLMNNLALWLPLLTLALLAGAVAIAKDRRRIVLWVGVGLVIAMIVPLEGINLARYPYVTAIERLGTIPNNAALAVYDTVLAGLLAAQRTVLAFGLVLWIAAALAGPSRFATRLRTGVQGGLSGVGSEWDLGPFGGWVHDHKPTLRTAGLLVAVLLLLVWSSPGVAGVVWVAVAALVWVVLVEFFGREPATQPAEEVEEKPAYKAARTPTDRAVKAKPRPRKKKAA